MNKILTHLIVPLVVIAVGGAGAATMARDVQEAEAQAPRQAAPLVSVQDLSASQHTRRVEANGVVEATRTLTIVPEIGGKIAKVSPALIEGGRVEQGEVLLRIDASSYRIAAAQAKAEFARAEAELELEQGRARSATQEWERFGSKESGSSGRLASRGPQMASAQALVELRKAAVDKAALDLRRATIRAPFAAIVTSEQVEIGQVVSQGVSLATLIASDQMWVRASIRLEDLSSLRLADAGEPGSEVRMRLDIGRGQGVTLVGEALRLGAEIDTDTRKAELIIRVPAAATAATPLLPGAFVTLELSSPQPSEALRIPREAVVEGQRVWLVDAEDRLVRLELDVAWTDQDAVYVETAQLPVEWRDKPIRAVVRPFAGALEGMKVQVSARGQVDHG